MKDALKTTDAAVSELVSLHERPAPNQDGIHPFLLFSFLFSSSSFSFHPLPPPISLSIINIRVSAAFLSHMPFDSYLECERALMKQMDESLVSAEQRDPRDAITQYNFLGVTEIPPALMKGSSFLPLSLSFPFPSFCIYFLSCPRPFLYFLLINYFLVEPENTRDAFASELSRLRLQ